MTILKCDPCKPGPGAEFQDKRYGLYMRVMSSNGKGDAKCSVCGTVHHGKGEAQPRKKQGSGGGRTYMAIPPAEGWPGGHPDKNGWRP